MSHRGEFLSRHLGIMTASLAMLIVAGPLAYAQQKPIALAVSANAASSAKPQTVINKPGSYILNKNIINNSKNGADSVLITASNVTINLQGFEIMGSGTSTGNGINATGQTNVVVTDGIILGFGGAAVITGNAGRISNITATGNGSGIICGNGCLARDNVVQNNTGFGMTFSDATSGYLGNVLAGNGGINVADQGQITGGTSLGQNLCNGFVC